MDKETIKSQIEKVAFDCMGENFEFRPNQLEAIVNIVHNIVNSRNQNYVLEAPTGTGKSIINILAAKVLWEFYEYGSDRIFHFDMQKDTLVTSISSVAINPDKKNKVLTYNNIDKTVLYNKENEPILTISNGYLDLGLIDTMGDLFVNFIGA